MFDDEGAASKDGWILSRSLACSDHPWRTWDVLRSNRMEVLVDDSRENGRDKRAKGKEAVERQRFCGT